MKIHHLAIILFIFIWQPSFAQNQNNNWCFGDKAGLTFSNGNPQAFTSSQMTSIEGCASVSDPVTGKLLFYSNGLQVWDANNNVMPNGNGLLAGPSTSSTQGVFITPYPGNAKLYYLFTTDETSNGGANGIRYSLIDLSLNNGLGWGELIYKTNNQKDQWDGTYLGLDCPNGVYIYLSKYNFFQQPQKEQNGPLMLLR
jgi:hypothetical protein